MTALTMYRRRLMPLLALLVACEQCGGMTGVEGTVFRPDGQTLLVDADVGLYSYHRYETRTDEDGRFRFAGVEPGDYVVRVIIQVPLEPGVIAAAEAFAKSRARRSVFDEVEAFEEIAVESKLTVEPGRTAQLTMQLHGAVVQGVVTTDAGAPAVGARVIGGGRSRFTDHAGRFELTHMPVGRCGLQVQGRNQEFRNVTVDVAPGADATAVEITLYPFRPQVIFRFTTPDGDVLANERLRYAHRRIAHNGFGTMSGRGGIDTDEHGRWKHEFMDSSVWQYAFFSTPFGYAEQIVSIGEGMREVHYDITLRPGGSICGTVRDQLTGAPLGGLVLRPTQVGTDGWGDSESMWNGLAHGFRGRVQYPLAQVSRDGDGTFCLTNLPPGTYGLAFGRGGYAREITLEDGEDVTDVEIVVETRLAQRWIVGRVLGPDMAPVVNTEVTFVVSQGAQPGPFPGGSRGVPRRAVTDDLGLFRVGPLDAREYRLTASIPGHSSTPTPVDVTAESIDAGDLLLAPVEGR